MNIARRIWRRLASWKWRILLVYLLLLAASFIVRTRRSQERIAPDVSYQMVPAIRDDQPTARLIRLAYKEYRPENNPQAPVVVLLQGSPGDNHDFRRFAPKLAGQYHVIAPDLPSFGSSTHDIPDYSNRAHAHYVLELLDQLHVDRAHFVGFSMGGGVALQIADIAATRVASLTMLSGIGVQEMELLGNYHLNHSIHGLQLAFLWFLREGVPHFGWFDHSMLDISYARNFYDTDQRPLRAILQRYAGPMLIIHGSGTSWCPSKSRKRIIDWYRSELRLFPEENHFYIFSGALQQAAIVLNFFDRVEQARPDQSDCRSRTRQAGCGAVQFRVSHPKVNRANRSADLCPAGPGHSGERRPDLCLGWRDGRRGPDQLSLCRDCLSGWNFSRRHPGLPGRQNHRPRGTATRAAEVVCEIDGR